MAYSQFHDGFWTDPEIRGLSSDDKLILAWFITNPYRHYSGVYFFEFNSIATQTGLSEKNIRKGIDTLSKMGFIKYNLKFSMVWVVKMFKWRLKTNSDSEKGIAISKQQLKGIANHFVLLHKCPLIKDFLEYYGDLGIPYQYPIDTHARKEEVKEEEKEKEKEKDIIASPKKDNGDALPFFSCPFFDVLPDYRQKLFKEYPLLTDDLLRKEFSKMEDWITDNRAKKKFKANGQLGNPRLFIKNWLNKIIITPPKTTGDMDAYLDFLGDRDGVIREY